MFNLFKRKSEKEKLQIKHKQLLKEAYTLSKSNRRLSDEKIAQAEEIVKQIEKLN